MSDAALIKLATIEWHELTDEAKLILLKELEKRKIDLTNSDDSQQEHNYSSINFKYVDKHIIQYITEQKIKNESDVYIIGGLLERGIEENTAIEIINSFPLYLEERKNKMSQTILTGTLQLVSGIAIIELPLRKETQLAVIIIGYSLLILGFFRIFHGILNKKKINKMLKA
jgi:hypothetical protein